MRQFASGGFRLWNLGVEAKVLYSAFCLLTLFGILSSALYYGELVGPGLKGVRHYYAGEGEGDTAPPPPAAVVAPPRGGGPAIEIPAEVEAQRRAIDVAITYRKLLEVTHFHLFTMPVVLLIVGHLFFATGLGARAKLIWVGAASASVTLHIATPWLVRFGSPHLAILHALSGGALTVTMGVLTIYPVFAMWRKPPGKAADAQRA
jgi:hypothetical protein